MDDLIAFLKARWHETSERAAFLRTMATALPPDTGRYLGGAARLAFPDWKPDPADWTSLHTSFDHAGAPYTEVAVYRGHDRIHYARYAEPAVTEFWTRLLDQISE